MILNRRKAFLSAVALASTSGLMSGLGLGLPGLAAAQQGKGASRAAAIQVGARGRAAIGRTRGRLEFGLQDAGFVPGAPVFLRIIKDQARLEVFVRLRSGEFKRYRTYRICGGAGANGPRTAGAPNRVAEGVYGIGINDLRPADVAYLGLSLGWPNARDLANRLSGAPGLIQAGCAAPPHIGLTDTEMEELFTLVWLGLAGGQAFVPVHVFPFAMTPLAMLRAGQTPLRPWWNELEPIWSQFERTKTPPVVKVQGRRYVVAK